MSSSPFATEPADDGRSFPVFMDAGLLSPFNLKRGLFFVLFPLAALAVCVTLGQGVLALALMAIGFWPFPFRCRTDRGGLRVSWLVVDEYVRWDEILAAQLVEDRRWGIVARSAPALFIERRNKRRVILRGRTATLSRLAAEISLHT